MAPIDEKSDSRLKDSQERDMQSKQHGLQQDVAPPVFTVDSIKPFTPDDTPNNLEVQGL